MTKKHCITTVSVRLCIAATSHCCSFQQPCHSWPSGDKSQRRRKQREEKAATVAALLQSAIGDEKFGNAVEELESSFGARFSEFITGQHVGLQLYLKPQLANQPVLSWDIKIAVQTQIAVYLHGSRLFLKSWCIV